MVETSESEQRGTEGTIIVRLKLQEHTESDGTHGAPVTDVNWAMSASMFVFALCFVFVDCSMSAPQNVIVGNAE